MIALYSLALLVSAALLFLLEPMAGKFVLPLLGPENGRQLTAALDDCLSSTAPIISVTAPRCLRSPSLRSTMELLPTARRCLGMCEEWWMWRRRREAEEARRLWDEFERTRPVSEPERIDEREVTLEAREGTPTAAES